MNWIPCRAPALLSRTFTIVLALVLTAPSPLLAAGGSNITDADIARTSNTSDWLAYGRTHDEQRFSPLTDINATNVGELGAAWHLDLPTDSGLVSTPLIANGVLYFTGSMNVVRAVDARSGKLLWSHDPQVAEEIAGRKKTGWMHNRGLSLYGNKLFSATWDGRLQALDLQTGRLIWSTRTFDMGEPLYITGAPKAFKNKVLIGNGGTENGPSRGYVTAYDTDTGKQVWRFYIVPGNPADGFENDAMAMAAKTWTGNWWERGGGGNAWHAFTYDEELDALYIGTGNGSPWNQKLRSPDGGDNLFLCSIVALDPDTGEYRWHYQTTPGETWDYNSNMDIVLADLNIKGKPIKAILHAPKNGFFYVLDRSSGKLISAEPFADVTWATHIDMKTGRPVERAGARYEDGSENITPGPYGAHNFQAMSYNPMTGLVYIPTIHMSVDFTDKAYDKTWQSVPFEGGTAVDYVESTPPRSYPGSLQAWDPIAQRQVWSVELRAGQAAGTLTTAGDLVFQGRTDGLLKAYHARTGQEIWSFDAGLGISAPPITYKLEDTQYVSILVGYGGGYTSRLTPGPENQGWSYGVHTRRLLTFALNGKDVVPKQPAPFFVSPILEPGFEVDPVLAKEGEKVYLTQGCYACHGVGGIAGGMAPDLRASAIPLSEMEKFFTSVVRDGERVARGMPGYPEITDAQLTAIRHYVRREAHAATSSANSPIGKP